MPRAAKAILRRRGGPFYHDEEPMLVKLLRPVHFKRIGTVLDVPGGVAETWIMQRKAELVQQPAPVQQMVPARRLDIEVGLRRSRKTTA